MRKLLWNSVMLLSGVILLAALALILSLLMSGPHQSQANPPAMSSTGPTPVVTPRSYPDLDPELVSALTTDWPVFKHREFGLQIRYPPTYFTKEWQVSGDRLFYVSFVDQKWRGIEGEIPDIGLVIYGNPQGLLLDEWFHKHSGHFTPSGLPEGVLFVDPTQIEPVLVRGHTALRFIDGGLGPAPSILIDRGPQIVRLYFTPVGPDNLEPIYELMLSTLEFIK